MASSAWRSSHCASECICPKWSSHKVRIGTSGDSSKRWRNESALPQLFFSSVVIRQIKGDNLQRGLGVVMCANPDGRSFYL
jgi:hypothetical protein